jgi:hypothetical protein
MHADRLYDEVKKFFYDNDKYDFVIEMSNQPMNQWKLIYVFSHHEMENVRTRLSDTPHGFAGFMNYEGNYYFYFLNNELFKTQILDTREIIEYNDKTFSEIDLNKVIAELRQLQGS